MTLELLDSLLSSLPPRDPGLPLLWAGLPHTVVSSSEESIFYIYIYIYLYINFVFKEEKKKKNLKSALKTWAGAGRVKTKKFRISKRRLVGSGRPGQGAQVGGAP